MFKNSPGYKTLMEAVMNDCQKGENCFNPNGCNHEFYRTVPETNQLMLERGHLTACRHVSKCSHKYCDHFKWIIDRANHYAEKTGLPAEDILNKWEELRHYWYMNYYQDCNQPEIKSDKVRVFETVDDFLKAIGESKFRCPLCGGISTDPYECNSGIIVKEIKDGKDGPCDWKVYGFLKDLGKGVFVFCKDQVRGERIFMPVSWEEQSKEA